MSTKLYVGNISWQWTKDDLFNLFQQYGTVEDCFIPMDRETGRSRGFGFVTMPAGDAQAAIQSLNESEQDVSGAWAGDACDPAFGTVQVGAHELLGRSFVPPDLAWNVLVKDRAQICKSADLHSYVQFIASRYMRVRS
jgi:RNA recognition motif-containing protein